MEIFMEELNKKLCYVLFTFADGTKQMIRTTLNRDILRNYGVSPRKGQLFDVLHSEWIYVRSDASYVDISEEKPEMEGKLDAFANRFI